MGPVFRFGSRAAACWPIGKQPVPSRLLLAPRASNGWGSEATVPRESRLVPEAVVRLLILRPEFRHLFPLLFRGGQTL